MVEKPNRERQKASAEIREKAYHFTESDVVTWCVEPFCEAWVSCRESEVKIGRVIFSGWAREKKKWVPTSTPCPVFTPGKPVFDYKDPLDLQPQNAKFYHEFE